MEVRNCFVDNERWGIADLTNEMIPGSWTITRINIPKEHRGKGYGTKLLEQIITEADACKETLTLEIMPSGDLNYTELEEWYFRHGFKASRRYPGFYFKRPAK